MSDLGEVSEKELHNPEALRLEINNDSDDEEEKVDESETDTEEQINGTGYSIQGRTYRWRKNYSCSEPPAFKSGNC